jgi:hypothetical protein
MCGGWSSLLREVSVLASPRAEARPKSSSLSVSNSSEGIHHASHLLHAPQIRRLRDVTRYRCDLVVGCPRLLIRAATSADHPAAARSVGGRGGRLPSSPFPQIVANALEPLRGEGYAMDDERRARVQPAPPTSRSEDAQIKALNRLTLRQNPVANRPPRNTAVLPAGSVRSPGTTTARTRTTAATR